MLKPYALLPEPDFGDSHFVEKAWFRFAEPRLKDLGKGRGRVRRICVRTEDGRQVNLLAVSNRPPLIHAR